MGKTPLNPFGTKAASPINPFGKSSRSILNPFGSKAPADQAAQDQIPGVPAPTPPASVTSQDVIQAGIDLRQQEARKKGLKKSVVAGETGGWRGEPRAAYGMPSAPSVKVP